MVRSSWFLLALCAVLSAGVLTLFYRKLQPVEPIFPHSERTVVAGSITTPTVTFVNPQKGDKYAALTVVLFSDFGCSHCKQFSDAFAALPTSIRNNVRLVWKHAPSGAENPLSKTFSIASACAANQGDFWGFHDTLFAAQPLAAEADLSRIAVSLSLDETVFKNCLETQNTLPLIDRDIDEAIGLGLRATPTFFIGQERFEGAYTTDALAELFETHLK